MKLLLTSGGITNKSISRALFELAGRPAKKLKLAFIPTAANVEDGDKSWLIDDLNICKKLGFPFIDIVDISAVPFDIWKSKLDKADVLLFGGGNVFYLMHWVKKSGLAKLLPEMLKTKVYAGISAGSMILTKNFISSEQIEELYQEKSKFKMMKGLGLTDFMVSPHLNSKWFPSVRIEKIQKAMKNITDPIYAIDDDTAIKVVDRKVTIVSEGKWKKFN